MPPPSVLSRVLLPIVALVAWSASVSSVSAQSPGELTVVTPEEIAEEVLLTGDTFSIPGDDLAFESASQRNALVIYGGENAELTLANGAAVTVANSNLTAFVRVGYGSAGSLVIEDGAALMVGSLDRYANFHVGQGPDTVGTVTQTGGTFTSIGSFNVGVNGGTGVYTISGGSLIFDHAGPDAGNKTSLISVGFNNATDAVGESSGTFNIAGGLVELEATEDDGVINFIVGNRSLDALTVYNGPEDVGVVKAGEGHGVVNQTGGTFRVGAGAQLFLSAYGNGEYNLNGGTLEAGGTGLQEKYGNHTDTSYSFNLGGGTIKVIDSALVTSVDMSLTPGTTSTIDTNGIGATFTGNITSGGAHQVDFGGSSLVKTGIGTLTFSGSSRVLETFAVTEGTVEQTAGVTSAVEFMAGTGAGNTGAYVMEGGTLTVGPSTKLVGGDVVAGSFRIGDFGGVGTFTQNAGDVTMLANTGFNIGNQGGTGTYELNGGTLTLNGGLHVLGRAGSGKPVGQGTIELAGGLLHLTDGGSLINGNNLSGGPAGSGTINQTGGTLRVSDGGKFYLSGYSSAGAGAYNLHGGTLEIGGSESLMGRYNNSATTYAFNLGGGTIKVIDSDFATSAVPTLVEGTTSTIDTNGLNAALTAGLAGTGGFDKTGSGALALGGTTTLQGHSSVQGVLQVGNGVTATLNLESDLVVRVEDIVGRLQVGVNGGTGTVTVGNGGSFTIDDSAAAGGTWGSLDVGRGAGSTGVFNHTRGAVAMSGGALQIGYSGGSGSYTLSNDATLSLNNGSSVFLGSGSGANGLLTVSGDSSVTSASQVFVGAGVGASGTITQDGPGSTVTFNGPVVAFGTTSDETSTPGTGIYNLQAGTLNLEEINAAGTYGVRFGDGSGGTGTLNQSGGTLNATNSHISFGRGGTGTYTLSGGTAVIENGLLKIGDGGTGYLNLTGGSLSVHVKDVVSRVQVGIGGGTGIATMTGGSLTIDEADATTGWGTLDVGRGSGSSGSFTQSGGTVTTGGALQIGYERATGTYTLTGGTLQQGSGTGMHVYLGDGAGGNGQLILGGSGEFFLDATAYLDVGTNGGTGTLTQNGAESKATFNGDWAVFGSSAVGPAGTGTYNLQAGTLEVNSGTFVFGHAGGTGNLNQSGGVLDSDVQLTIGGGGTGDYTLSGGTATLKGGLRLANGGTGTLNLDGGTLELGGVNGLRSGGGTAAFNFGGGTLRVIGNTLTTSVAAALGAGTISTIDTNGMGATWSGNLTGVGGLRKSGAGALTLSGAANNFGALLVEQGSTSVSTGATTVGQLLVGATGSGANGTFELTGGTVSTTGNANGDYRTSYIGSGAGNTGTVVMSGGTLNVGLAATPGVRADFEVGSFSGSGTMTQTGGDVVFNSTAGYFHIGNQGTGVYNLEDGNITTLNAFVLGRSTGAGLGDGTLNISGGSLTLATDKGALIVGGVDGSGTVGGGKGVINQTGGVVSVGSYLELGTRGGHGVYNLDGGVLRIGGAGGLRADTNGYDDTGDNVDDVTGSYEFNLGGGTLQVMGSSLTSAVAMTLKNGTMSTIDTNGLGATFSGVFSGTGGVAKSGEGALTFSGTSTFSGGTLVSEGTLIVNGSFTNSTVSVGDGATLGGHGSVAGVNVLGGGRIELGGTPGTFTITGDLSLAGTSRTLLYLAATSNDRLAVGGTLFAGGVFDVRVAGEFDLLEGASFDLFDGTLNGTFASVLLPTLGSGLEWNLANFSDGVISVMTASAIPEPSTWAAIVGGMALVVAAWRRRGSRAPRAGPNR